MDEMSCEDIIYSEEYGDYIIETFDDPEVARELYEAQCAQVVSNRSLVLYQRVVGNPEETLNIYGYTAMPKCYGIMDTTALEEAGILRLRRQPYLDLYGSGVLIGIIDTGIDYLHPAFINADGSSRIYSIWDQTVRSGSPPEGFYYGTEYKQAQIEEAISSENPAELVPVTDESGHGTFLAGIVAGNELPEEDFSGIAPLSDLVVVKLKEAKNNLKSYYGIGERENVYQENDIMLGIRYVQAVAAIRRMPIVVLLGLGTNAGNHSGELQLSRYMNRSAVFPGIVMVSSAGNEGNQGHHYQRRLLEAGGRDIVEINIAEGETGVTLELWTEAPQLFTVGIRTPLGNTTGILPIWYGRGTIPITFPLENSRVFVEYTAVETNTGDEVIVIRILRPAAGIWRIEVVNNTEYLASFNMWMPISGFLKSESRFLSPEPDITICEPGNARSVLTSTAYNHVDGSIYIAASRGFTSTGEIKPELAAPGVAVYGPAPGGGFTARSGTSVGAAFCAGAAALMLEWGVVRGNNLGMQTTEVSNVLIRGADRESNLEYPNRIWGYGKLDVYTAFGQLRP
ncbi:MAG: S8 family peptidase [Acetivibrio ethanolgignens]